MYKVITNQDNEIYVTPENEMLSLREECVADFVNLNDLFTETSTQGVLTSEQLSVLQENTINYVLFNSEIYRLNADNQTEGYLTYSCVDYENGVTIVKTITITIATHSWVLNDVIVNAQPSNPNLLHNAEFKLNQRGKTTYEVTSTADFCVDRWRKDGSVIVTVLDDGGITFTNTLTTDVRCVSQYIHNSDLLFGQKITITMCTPEKTYVFTSNPLPAKNRTQSYTAVQTFDTDFGYIEIYFGSKNFSIRLQQNPPTTAEEATPVTVNWVKVELGVNSTPLTPVSNSELEKICKSFYTPANNGIISTGFVKYTSSKSEYTFECPVVHEMYGNPTIKVQSLDGSISNGGVLTDVTFDSITIGGRNTNKNYYLITCTINEDNTAKLNGETEKYEFCIGKYNGVYIQAEITT